MIINSKHVGGGGTPIINPLSITENGTYTAPSGVDGYSPVSVNVSSGDINPLLYAKSVSFDSQTLPRNFEVTLGANLTGVTSLFDNARPSSGEETPVLTLNAPGNITNINHLIYGTRYDKFVLNLNTSIITDWGYAFGGSYIKEIVGLLDFSSATTVNRVFYQSTRLEKMTIAPNTLALSLPGEHLGSITDDTLVSIANGLNETATGKTLTLHATPKAKCSTIMGNVAMDESNTYHIFTADVSGTVTLENFITQTKGWTLA